MDESRIAVNLFLRSVIEETKVKCRTLIDPDGLDSTQMPFKRVKTTHEDLDVKIKNEAVCDWTGPLRTAEDHFVQCPFKVVICPNDGCTAQMMRKNITGHEGGCLYRLIPCTFCSERFKFFELDEHRELCPCRVVECPNRCTVDSSEHAELTQVPLDKLDEHKKECLLEIIKCPFFLVGCPVETVRKNITMHLEGTGIVNHLSSVLVVVETLRKDLGASQENISRIQQKLIKSDNEVTLLQAKLNSSNAKALQLEGKVKNLESKVAQSDFKLRQIEISSPQYFEWVLKVKVPQQINEHFEWRSDEYGVGGHLVRVSLRKVRKTSPSSDDEESSGDEYSSDDEESGYLGLCLDFVGEIEEPVIVQAKMSLLASETSSLPGIVMDLDPTTFTSENYSWGFRRFVKAEELCLPIYRDTSGFVHFKVEGSLLLSSRHGV